MAIYNTGRYLSDSIGSLLNQSCGFNKIQLILINDGSLDNTHKICMEYVNKYPNNIQYKNIEHGGVSKARNVGLEFAKGKYINFMDSDDLWDSMAFEHILSFYKKHKNIDIVAGRIKFFEAINGYHLLDYKFKKTRIVNLIKEYTYIQTTASTCFFRAKRIINFKFFERIKYNEDYRFINTLLLNKPKIGFVKEALYYYRRRKDGTSAVQNFNKDKKFYIDTMLNVHQFLINVSIIKYNQIVPFIQYLLAYDIVFRIKSVIQKYLDNFYIIKYMEIINKILNNIDEKFILEQRHASNIIKLFILSKKYGKDLRNDLIFENNYLKYKEKKMINFNKDKNIIACLNLYIKNDILHIELKDNFWVERDKYYYYGVIGNEIYYPKYKDSIIYNFNTFYGTIVKGRIVLFDITIKKFEKQVIHIFISYLKNKIEIFPNFDLLQYIPPLSNGYYTSGNFILKIEDGNLIIYQYQKDREILFETKYLAQLKFHKKEYLIKLREFCFNYRHKINRKKKIWFISDSLNKAGDNGEYFFRFINENKRKEINSYFIISQNSRDYKRLKIIGNVIPIESKEYAVKYLITDKIISSNFNPRIYNPFGKDEIYIYDLLQFDYIYLQNRINENNPSFNFLNKNFKYLKFVTIASKKEYQFFISKNFIHNKANIKLTGFSRYDSFQRIKKTKKDEKFILIIPTSRISLKIALNCSEYNPFFKNSQYFKFYNNLINNEKLLKTMDKYNYTGYFCLHQSLKFQFIDFCQNSQIQIKDCSDIQELLSNASLLVTDYSKVFFDFAYMEKPIIFTQFDFKEYSKNEKLKGYFDYTKDGFGPIYNNIEKSIDGIIYSIENGCLLKKKYLRRIKKYFAYFDDKNSIRIFNEIIGLSKNIYTFYIIDKYIFYLEFIFIFFFLIFKYIYY